MLPNASISLSAANLSDANNTFTGNVSAKKIGGVIYADQYATIQDAINASNGGDVIVPTGTTIVSSAWGTFDGARVGIKIPENVCLRGSNINGTTIKQGSGLNTHAFVLLAGKGACLKDITIDFNGYNQVYSVGPGTYYGAVLVGITNYPADYAQVENVKILNTVGKWQDDDLNMIGLNYFNAPYAIGKRLFFNTYDFGLWLTKAFPQPFRNIKYPMLPLKMGHCTGSKLRLEM